MLDFASFIDEFENELEGRAVIFTFPVNEVISAAEIRPLKPNSAPIKIAWSPHEIVVTCGESGRFELAPTLTDLMFLGKIIHAVSEGRFSETIYSRGSRYSVVLEGGDVVRSAFYEGFTPFFLQHLIEKRSYPSY